MPRKTRNKLSGYSGTPLPKKLGIKPGFAIVLVGAPEGFESMLEPLPEGVRFRRRAVGSADLVIWFVESAARLRSRTARLGELSPGMWICWPKKASGRKTDITQDLVRAAGLGAGLVDYKVCAIDETWSGLKFAPRRG